ncbi:MAG: DUF2807 domain-containing protein, partial [Clostridia bacterium]|nr:DUF2807 domain-containing protein [Clostridia bacterium]
FNLFRKLILLVIILIVAVVGYFTLNGTKDIKDSEAFSNRVELDISKTYTLDVYKLGVSHQGASINLYPVNDGESYVEYIVNKAIIDEYGFEIKVDDTNSKIDISTKHNYGYKVSYFTINIYCNFNKLILSSPLKYNVDASNIGNRLDMTYHGTGSLNVTGLNLTDINLKTTSSGVVTLSGHANNVVAESSGRGDINAKDLITSTADIKLRADGNMTITATTNIVVVLDGKGNLHYYGNATTEKSGSGTGTVFQAQE